jgi:hypothetical protein
MKTPRAFRGDTLGLLVLLSSLLHSSHSWISSASSRNLALSVVSTKALSGDFLENDLVAIQKNEASAPRFWVVRPDGIVAPLCRHEDDVETDLHIDPRCYDETFWETEVSDETVKGTYGEGWYGQRPVPSLGGGPGYGADAQEIWSIDEELLEQLATAGVELPILDVGIAHGEKARGGFF